MNVILFFYYQAYCLLLSSPAGQQKLVGENHQCHLTKWTCNTSVTCKQTERIIRHIVSGYNISPFLLAYAGLHGQWMCMRMRMRFCGWLQQCRHIG